MQQRSLQQVRVSVSLIFLIHGLIIATWASRIPAFQAHLHLSPAVLGRSLMMAAIGSVLAMPAAGWLIHKFGSLSIVIGSTLGFGLALPLIAESNAVLTLSVALLFYGAMAGSMDVAMNTHAVMLEKRYQRHIMSSFHALFSLGGMAGSALGGLVAPGPSLAVVTTAGYVGFLAGPPLIGFVAQLSTIRAALWILVVLSGLSAFASTSMKRTSPPLRRTS